MRRVNEDNVDPNRNFLLPDEPYVGCPNGYLRLDPLLNPRRPPSRWEPFRMKAAAAVLRHGMPALVQAIAAGQYDFPRGLFYGGSGPIESHRIVREFLPNWIGRARRVLHLDFHTGLGRWARYQLLRSHSPDEKQSAWLRSVFGEAFQSGGTQGAGYQARGDLGHWCERMFHDCEYTYLCAEFGTYPLVSVLAGLRAENQAHHWGDTASSATQRAKQTLRELFCPADSAWRDRTVRAGVALIDVASAALTSLA